MLGRRVIGNILGGTPKKDKFSRNSNIIKSWKKGPVELKLEDIDGEYRVSWFNNGVYSEAKSYYTDDMDDAVDTANDMLRRL